MMQLLRQSTFLLDLDGTVYRGAEPIPGAAQAVRGLKALGRGVLYISNNSTHTPAQLAFKLRTMGIAAKPDDFVTPLRLAGAFIARRFGRCSVFVVGEDALKRAVRAAGHRVMNADESACRVVLVGRCLAEQEAALAVAARHLRAGARLIACNTDLTHPGAGGKPVLETGYFLRKLLALQPAPYVQIGKPAPHLFRLAGRPEETVMVGDNPLTDILGGKRAGCRTVLVHCGAPDRLPAIPDIRLNSIGELLRYVK